VTSRAALEPVVRAQLGHTLDRAPFTQVAGRGPLRRYDGKVRDCLIDDARAERILIISDRLSAFDRVITTLPFKGQVLNQMAAFWFEHAAGLLAELGATSHVVGVPDPNVMVVREVRALACEFVMRAYLTGVTSTSVWRAYEQGARTFCGHALPDGLRKNQALPGPILTPSTKAAQGDHDVSVSRAELLAMGVIDAGEFDRAAAVAAALFAAGQRHAASRGLILADTKYELGVDAAGRIVVIDEIHTPDSSRYWYADDYAERLAAGAEPRSLDKEYVRRHLSVDLGYGGDGPVPVLADDVRVEAALRYIESYQLVTGRDFVPDVSAGHGGDPVARVAAALGAS
jgi:phosphoribosylaminoimidazole-succinocarboxamide synthase